MPKDLKLSQIGSSQLPPPFRGLHSPGVKKHCKIIFSCYFRKSSIATTDAHQRPVRVHAQRPGQGLQAKQSESLRTQDSAIQKPD